MDVLSDTVAALRTGRPASGTFVRHAPWGRRYSKASGAGFHVVLQGSCWLIPRSAEPVPLGVGDVAFLYLDEGHGLADSPDTPLDEIPGPGEPRVVDGAGARSTLLCGVYEFAPDWSHPLLDELPEVVHVPARLGRHPELRAAVDLLTAELAGDRPGRDAMVPALLDVLLICTLRAWFDERAEGDRITGWASVFQDRAITAALAAMHDDPAHQWTVEGLGARIGMSRATFSRRFTALVGEPPLTYLTRWRMITAARRLRETDAALSVIAEEVGYASEYAFAKAFKRAHGAAPGQYRREQLAHRSNG
ncbi:AraC family transcriptional regulator [Saccharopolyspora shandongensis]|uniref:AraC family transcriptional regulator n=1 Tax=Saccharopolyspora shandongensis TaxID=418495 RepID=UPI00340B3303